MFTELKTEPLVKQIILLHNEYGDSIMFHKKCRKIIKSFKNLKFLYKVFERNLLNNSFINKQWNSCDIPYLNIYKDEKITIKYNIFSPVENNSLETAADLIHHHGNFILSSYIIYGPGYHTIEFEKTIIENNSNYILNPVRSFYHSNDNINILDCNTPHLVFNVSKTTSSVVIWSENSEYPTSHFETGFSRTSYFIKNGEYYGISEKQFINEISKNIFYENDSEKHIQSICYFLQELGYKNNLFISTIMSEKIPEKWHKWLKKIHLNIKIEPALFKGNLNTLGNEMKINDF